MFADRFSSLITEHPSEANALKNLADYFGSIEKRDGSRLFNLRLSTSRLFEIASVSSRSQLGQIIALLTSEDLLERVIIVESSSGTSAGEFSSYDLVPDEIYDENLDIVIEVTKDNISTIYKPVQK